MTQRLDFFKAAPQIMGPMLKLSEVANSSLEHSLVELVKLRASQINGCAHCIKMHTADARKAGETEDRIYMLNAWHELHLYSERERAALAWTEALTRLADTRAPDADYAEVKKHFTDEEQVKLSLVIGVINVWNRFCVGFRTPHA